MNALFAMPESLPAPDSAAGRASRRRSPRTQIGSAAPVSRAVQWALEPTITVVLFAGMGGACDGIEAAGYPVKLAVNHSKVAIAAHTALHPHTQHLQCDLHEVDPLEAVGDHVVGQIWASPDCRDFSSAKGGRPVSRRVRSLMWQICRWAGTLRRQGRGPGVVYFENVPEARGAGPLIAKRDKATGRVLKLDGTVAAKGERVPVQQQQLTRDPKKAGRRYRAWVRHMEGLGAVYEDRVLCIGDYGVPTGRRRLFGIAAFDGAKPVWPKETHGHRTSEMVRSNRRLPHVSSAEIIDWTIPMVSIFDRPKPLAWASQRRIAVGVKRFVMDPEKRYLVPMTMVSKGGTVDASGSVESKLSPFIEEQRTRSIGHSVDSPLATQSTHAHHAVVGTWLVQHNSGVIGHPAADPLSTLTTLGTQQQVAGAFLVHHRGTATALSLDDALPTVTTGGGRGGDHHGVGAAFLVEYYGTGGQHQGVDAALNTLSTRDRFAVAGSQFASDPLPAPLMARAGQTAAFLREHGVWDGGDVVTVGPYIMVDIGMRMLRVDEAAASHELTLPSSIRIFEGRRGRAPAWGERPLTKTEAMLLIGNSVPPRIAQLLVSLNAPSTLSRTVHPEMMAAE